MWFGKAAGRSPGNLQASVPHLLDRDELATAVARGHARRHGADAVLAHTLPEANASTRVLLVDDLSDSGVTLKAAQEAAVVGEVPHLAARLQAIAGPGELAAELAFFLEQDVKSKRMVGFVLEKRRSAIAQSAFELPHSQNSSSTSRRCGSLSRRPSAA